VRVTVSMSAADADVLAAAFARLRLDGGFGTDVENGTLLAEMARRMLAVLEADRTEATATPDAPTAERFRVTLHLCPDCEKTHVGDPAAPNRADATDLACAECDAEHLDLTKPDPAPRLNTPFRRPRGGASSNSTGIAARCPTAATASGSTCITSGPGPRAATIARATSPVCVACIIR
jgi:hypothetical protein